MSTDKDKIINELIEVVRKKKDEINKIEKPQWETNCVVISKTGTKNLKVLTLEETVKEFANITVEAKSYDIANATLNTSIEWTMSGSNFKSWENDFKNRIAQLTVSDKKKELDAIEIKLNSMISKEEREARELEIIKAKLLG